MDKVVCMILGQEGRDKEKETEQMATYRSRSRHPSVHLRAKKWARTDP